MRRKLAMEPLERRELLSADVAYTVAVLDPVTHNELPSTAGAYRIEPTQRIEIAVYAQDLRQAPELPGVYSAYVDVAFDSNLLTLDATTYDLGPDFPCWFQRLVVEGGAIRHAGGFGDSVVLWDATDWPFDGSPQLVFSVGATVSTGAPAGTTTRLALSVPVPSSLDDWSTIAYGADAPAVCDYHDAVLATAPANPWHNDANPFDVNADGKVNALDTMALLLALRRTGEGRLPQVQEAAVKYDVNGNGCLDRMDLFACQYAAWAQQLGPATANGQRLQRAADFFLALDWDVPGREINPMKRLA